MDDATPTSFTKTTLDEAVASMDQNDGFAVLHYKGREIILMSGEKFEAWEDAVDLGRIEEYSRNPDPEPLITLDELRVKYDISAPSK